jgi:four helix bundle protein
MPPRDLILRTRAFALAILEFCRTLPNTDEAREAARQLRRAATGLRSNYRAARKGRSRKEFTSKLGTASEEADECVDWLQYLRDGHIAHDAALLQEATEIAKIMATAYRTAKRNNKGNDNLDT